MPNSKKFVIDDNIKKSSQEDLFDFIVESVAEFIKDRNITKVSIGFSFAAPVKQEDLISGELIRWGKGYNVSEAIGKDVVQLLRDAFNRKRVSIQ